jgi:hypothetical protein
LQAATENITAKIQQENEKLMQKLHIEVKKLSSDMGTLQNDAENKFQEVTRTIGGVNDAMNERIDAHVVATRKMTDRISHEMNARSGFLRDDMKEYRTDRKQFEGIQARLQSVQRTNSEQATWQNKTGVEMDKVKDSVRLIEEIVSRLVEDRITEIQAAAQNNI